MFGSLWLISFVITVFVAIQKKLNVIGWMVLGFLLGPIALIIVLIVQKKTNLDKESTKSEIEALRAQLNNLAEKLNKLELKVGISSIATNEIPAASKEEVRKEQASTEEKREVLEGRKDLEVNVGRFWLNRIGIVIFTLGIGFLVSYTFRYFGAFAKIAFGYAVSICLFMLGLKMETKEKFKYYGRVLLGGAWAITYFTTYAMYHFDASRIINSQLLDLVLLALVALGIIFHSLKYKSQELSSVALVIGYLTATLADTNVFTLITCLVLAVVTLILVFKMQWVRMIFFGIALTYFTHIVWVTKHLYFSRVAVGNMNVNEVYFLINNGFLIVYWALFMSAVHVMRKISKPSIQNSLSVANFCNFLIFFFMAFPKFIIFYPDFKFTFVFCLGVIYLFSSFIMEKTNSKALFISDILIALSLLTLAVPLKYAPYQTAIIWLIELPFLILIGVYFEKKIVRYFSFLLSLVIFSKVIFYDMSLPEVIILFGYGFSWNKVISLLSFISFCICFCFSKRKGIASDNLEAMLNNLYSAFAVIFATIAMWLLVDPKWLTLSLFIEALVLSVAGNLWKDRYLRAYAFFAIVIASYRFCLIDSYPWASDIVRWIFICIEVLIAYCMYFIFRKLRNKSLLEFYEADIFQGIFVIATALLTWAMFKYVAYSWISIALGLEGMVLFVAGFLVKDRIFRWAGFSLFAITIVRVIFVDMSQLAIIYKIVSFIVLGILFLGVSFIYTKYTLPRQK